MFTLTFGNGTTSAPMSASELNELLANGIAGCGGAGTVVSVNVNGVDVDYNTFKAIYNAACVEQDEDDGDDWERDHDYLLEQQELEDFEGIDHFADSDIGNEW